MARKKKSVFKEGDWVEIVGPPKPGQIDHGSKSIRRVDSVRSEGGYSTLDGNAWVIFPGSSLKPAEAPLEPHPAEAGDRVKTVGSPSAGQIDLGPHGEIRRVLEARAGDYRISLHDDDGGWGVSYPPSSLEHEDGTPVAPSKAKEEQKDKWLMDGGDWPVVSPALREALATRRQQDLHRTFLAPFTFMGIDPATPSPLDRLQKEIKKRGLEDWAHEHLDQIDLLDSSDWGLLYSARKAIRIGMNHEIPKDAFRFVVVRGNIGQTHWLWVPPLCKTAEQAVAWTFGMLPGEYAPISES